jgi:hypothetical protein
MLELREGGFAFRLTAAVQRIAQSKQMRQLFITVYRADRQRRGPLPRRVGAAL